MSPRQLVQAQMAGRQGKGGLGSCRVGGDKERRRGTMRKGVRAYGGKETAPIPLLSVRPFPCPYPYPRPPVLIIGLQAAALT